MTAPKPGTRCECQEPSNRCHDCGGNGNGDCYADAVQFVTVRREVGEKFRYALGRDGVNATVVAHELDGYGKPTVTMVEFFYEGRKECLAAQETKSVPMCAACAAYHKAKGGR